MVTKMEHIYVIKRNGDRVPVSFDAILQRIIKLSDGLDHVNPDLVAQKVCNQLQDGMATSKLDEFAAETCAMMQARYHPNYGKLAARIVIDNHQKNTPQTLAESTAILFNEGIVSKKYRTISTTSGFEAIIDYSRDFMFDYFGFKTLERGYLLRRKDGRVWERPQHMWMRVAIQMHGMDFIKVKETYDALSEGYFIHATPTLFNSGTNHPQLSSCFLANMSEDSIKGIYETLGECAQISKWAGGIGLSIHNVRSRGSRINGTNGESTGIVPMLKVFNDTAKYVNQGGKRNGSFAIYLEPWHADIEDFLRLKLNQGAEEDRARDLFYGLWIPDLFMKRVEKNENWSLMCPHECPGLDECHSEEFEKLYTSYEASGKVRKTMPAQKLWQMVLDAQIQTGTPYLCYKDAANSKSNQKNLGTIKSSNLCVAPETMILTKDGYFPISDLKDTEVEVWNGDKWSKTIIRKTGENQKLLTVNFSNGASLTCTPYHKFLIHENYEDTRSIKNSIRIDAQDLKEGMKLKKFTAPIVEGFEACDEKDAYTHGFFCGDGTYSNGKPICTLYGEKKKLVQYLKIKSMSGVEDSSGRLNTVLDDSIDLKYKVPMVGTIQSKIHWLEGLSDADGTIARNGSNESLQISSIHFKFLDDIRMMILSIGIHAKVTKMHDVTMRMLPDGKGGFKEFECKPLWRLLVSSYGLYELSRHGFQPKRLEYTPVKPQRNAEQFTKVVCVVDSDRYDDTYCFNEPENHAGVFNGILTGNCTEIMEFSSPDETAVCNLGSLGLTKFVKNGKFDFEKLRECTRILTRNLNIVIDKNFYPTEKCMNSNMRNRPIGIGVQGLADVFALLRLSWTSKEASDLNREIFENMYFAAAETSVELAQFEKERWRNVPLDQINYYANFVGSPAHEGKLQYHLWNEKPTKTSYLDWDTLVVNCSKGMRNSLLIAPMPTASTSQILGNNECFEPFTSNLYTRRVLSGDFMMVNKYLVNELVDLGLWTADIRNQIMVNNGSVADIKEIPADVREIYKTVWEIPQKTLIQMSRDRAPFVCQSQSLNLFLAEPTYAKITSMHMFAWKQGLKTGCYYLRTKAASSAQKFTVDPTCLSCSA